MTMCGTPNYISPEIATRASHGLETDVWGLGVMLYTVLVGRPPFDTDDGIKSTLTLVVMSEIDIPLHLSPEVRDLMSSLLKKNPKDRIKLSKILEHPFMTRYQCMFISSNRWTSHDSGVASSSCLTSKSYSYSNSVLPVAANSNILPPRANPSPLPRSTSTSNVLTYDDQSIQTAKSLGIGHHPSASSGCSISSSHTCPGVIKNYSGGYANLETHSTQMSSHSLLNSGGQCHLIPGSQRCHSVSNPPSVLYSNPCNGCSNSVNHSHFSGCLNSRQPEPLKPAFYQHPQQNPMQTSNFQSTNAMETSQRGLQIPPINSKRLKSIRQKVKNVFIGILDSKEVYLEFLRSKDRTERVMEVIRISSDGLRVNAL